MSKRLWEILLNTASWHLLLSALTRKRPALLTCIFVAQAHEPFLFGVVDCQNEERREERTGWVQRSKSQYFMRSTQVCTFVILHQSLSVSACVWWNWKTEWGNVKPFWNGSLWNRAEMALQKKPFGIHEIVQKAEIKKKKTLRKALSVTFIVIGLLLYFLKNFSSLCP